MDFQPNNNFFQIPKRLIGSVVDGEDKVEVNVENGPGGKELDEKSHFEYLPGYNDPQTFFMMGEDVNTCMSIRARQKGTNRGLISFLVHGNNRILGIKDKTGRCVARAVARLLVDNITGYPVIYLDAPYGDLYESSSRAPKDALLDIYDQAAKLGRMMQLPVVYSTPPPESDYYYLGPLEVISTQQGKHNLVNLTDYSLLATHQWIEGLRFPDGDTYDNDFLPKLIRLREHHVSTGMALGFRPEGSLECIDTGRKYENILEQFKDEMELELQAQRDRENVGESQNGRNRDTRGDGDRDGAGGDAGGDGLDDDTIGGAEGYGEGVYSEQIKKLRDVKERLLLNKSNKKDFKRPGDKDEDEQMSLGAESAERDADVQGVKSSNGSSSRSEVPRRKMDQDNISLPPLSQNNGSDSDSDDDADLFG